MTPSVAAAGQEPQVTDVALIARVLGGDRTQFALLVQRHNQPVFRACRAILRNDQDAEDAVQIAWLNAFRALAGFRADSSFRTWVTRIAVNEASARLRSQRRFAAVLDQEMSVEIVADTPDTEVFTRELAKILEREVSALPEGLRAVLVLRDVMELDTAETASCLGIAEENVRVRLHRARQAVALRLTDSMKERSAAALPEMWRFDGERCARMLARVMAALPEL